MSFAWRCKTQQNFKLPSLPAHLLVCDCVCVTVCVNVQLCVCVL